MDPRREKMRTAEVIGTVAAAASLVCLLWCQPSLLQPQVDMGPRRNNLDTKRASATPEPKPRQGKGRIGLLLHT